jgi:phosphoglycolate phosphatase-like HAD superfamily hydrolase
MLISKERAAAQHRVNDFESFVYVGDAIWDLLACRSLEIPLIGVGSGPRAAQLKTAGAKYLLPDYSDPREFLNCVAAARSFGASSA